MNDTISAIRLLKRLKHRRNAFCKNRIQFLGLSKNDKARVDEMDKCIAEMINAPTIEPEREKGKWIPCSERLPEEEYVLISKKPKKYFDGGRCVTIAIRMEDPRSRKVNWRDIGFGVIPDDNVLAWMPSPEPYQGGETDEGN